MNHSNFYKLFLGLVAAFSAVSCGVDVELDRLEHNQKRAETRIKDIQLEIDRYQADIDKLEPDASRAEAAEKGITDAIEAKRAAYHELEELEPQVAKSIAILEAYRNAFRTPEVETTFLVIPGEKLGDFTLRGGKTVSQAVVTGTRPGELGVRHSTGIAYIPISDLPGDLRDKVIKETEKGGGVPPEASPRPIEDLKGILARKPDSLKTYVQQAGDRRAAYQAKSDKRETDRVARNKAENEQLTQMRAKEDAQRKAAAAESAARIDALREKSKAASLITAQISNLNSAIYSQERAKTSQKYQWSSANIKPSAQDQAKILGAYDAKIAALRRSIAELEKKKAEL